MNGWRSLANYCPRHRAACVQFWGPWLVMGLSLTSPKVHAAESGGIEALSQANTAFAFDLYERLKTSGGNLFISPYSISTCLAMVKEGAKGSTAQQILQVLHFDKAGDQLGSLFAALQKQLNEAQQSNGLQLHIANGLWVQKEHPFLSAFLADTKRTYDATLEQVDFQTQADEAVSAINGWVSQKTQGRIPRLFEPGMLNAQTRMALVNAIYFKGKWASPFAKQKTADAPFRMAGGRSVNLPMMNQTSRFKYAAADDLQLLELPYAGNKLTMAILLPKETEGVDKLELSAVKLSAWLAAARLQKVNVFIPRFRLETQYLLNRTLEDMGMREPFSTAADFSGMDGQRDLYLSVLAHKAFVEVNEEGTEAAAATGAGMSLTALEAPPPTFRADHPFVFLIRDTSSGTILFLGKLAEPKG